VQGCLSFLQRITINRRDNG